MPKEINLGEIFDNNFDCYTETMDTINIQAMSKEGFIKQVKLICKQTLELAVENAQIKACNEYMGEKFGYLTINKQSILNTINQIK